MIVLKQPFKVSLEEGLFTFDLGRIKLPGIEISPFHRDSAGESSLGKAILHKIFPREVQVEGTGINLETTEFSEAPRNNQYLKNLKHQSQINEPWQSRILTASLISRISLDRENIDKPSNQDLLEHLKKSAKPGDIIFVTGGGKSQGLFDRMLTLGIRLITGKNKEDRRFPFTHVMINVGDGTIIDLTRWGQRKRTWDEVFVKSEYYDCIALGALQCSQAERSIFCDKLQEVTKKLTKFNIPWMALKAPFEIFKQRNGWSPDSSVKNGKCVCIDYATESARLVTSRIPHLQALSEVSTPLQAFECNSLKIVAAVNLIRNN